MKIISVIALVFALCLVGQVVEAIPANGRQGGGNMLQTIMNILLQFWNGLKARFGGEGSFGSGFTSDQSVEGTIDHTLGISSDTTGKAGGEFEGIHEGNVGGDFGWY
ncbi:hypothetical protein SNEBB_002272 [Seison nebaliae]|nr:hypothetical protein SNEBB_002272 [Seison nebaliae]